MNNIVEEMYTQFQYKMGCSQLLGTRERLSLYRRFERFASRGYDVKIPLEDMLGRSIEKNRITRHVLEEWVRGINGGQRFSELIGPHVSSAERMAIASGEETGKVGEGFQMAAYIVESSSKLRSALSAGLAYPMVLLGLFMVMLVFISWFLIPTLETLHPVDKWPFISAALYYTASTVRSVGWIIFLALLALVVVILIALPKWTGPFRRWLDVRLPPWMVYREIQSGMLLVALSGVVQSGSPIDEAFRRLKRSASPWLEHHLELALRRIAEGMTTARAMDTGLMSEELMDDMLAYDRAGAMSESILLLGRDCVELVVERIKRIASVFGALLMVGVGLGLAWSWGSFVMVFIAMRSGY